MNANTAARLQCDAKSPIHRDTKKPAPNTLSYNAIISQYSFNKFYEMFEEVKDCKQ